MTPVSWRASWTRMEPTPPLAPMTSREADVCGNFVNEVLVPRGMWRRSKSSSQAGDGGERQGGGLGKGERAGLGAGEALIDQVELAVGAGTEDGAGVEDLVSGLEER